MKTYSPDETKEYARSIAKKLSTGAVFALSGALGSGKTVFAKGIAEGLGITGQVSSPTFVLMDVHEIPSDSLSTFVHIDCYRLDSPDQLLEIGAGDYLNDPNVVIVIEWAEKVRDFIPKSARWFEFSADAGSERTIIEHASD